MNHVKRGLIACLLSLTACGGHGDVALTIWGEEFIQDQIPARAGAMAGFENGWTLHYTRFLVNAGNFTVASSISTSPGGSVPGFRVYDLHTLQGPLAIGTVEDIDGMRWNRVSYEIVPASASSSAGNATAADLQLMQSNGFSVYVEGEATPTSGTPVRIQWGFTNNTLYEDCHDAMAQEGVVVPSGSVADAQITIHGDHLFYDDLQSPTALVRFDAIAAADRDGDHLVTIDELGMVDLTSLPTGQYGTGSAPNINTLRDFVTSLVATIGHFSGEGHCEERRR